MVLHAVWRGCHGSNDTGVDEVAAVEFDNNRHLPCAAHEKLAIIEECTRHRAQPPAWKNRCYTACFLTDAPGWCNNIRLKTAAQQHVDKKHKTNPRGLVLCCIQLCKAAALCDNT